MTEKDDEAQAAWARITTDVLDSLTAVFPLATLVLLVQADGGDTAIMTHGSMQNLEVILQDALRQIRLQ